MRIALPGTTIEGVEHTEAHRAELATLRAAHNYRAFMTLSLLLFASCAIFLAQKVFLPDSKTSTVYTLWYARLYIGALIFSPLFASLVFLSWRKGWTRLVTGVSILFSFGIVALGLALTVLDFHDYQNLTATYIATIGISIMLSAPCLWYAGLSAWLLVLFTGLYFTVLKSDAHPSLIVSMVFLAGLNTVLGVYTERVRTKTQLARLEMRELMIRDHLTGLYNRAFLTEYLTRLVEGKHRYSSDISCILIDVDHFKHINDSLGHQSGDRVLSALSARLQASIRQADVIARMGGEEFLVVLPQTGLENALIVAEKLRKTVAAEPLEGSAVTISLGVGAFDEDEHFESLYHRIDEALYRAKRGGRNRVEASREG